MEKKKNELNHRQQRFLENLCLGMCYKDAYIRAGYKAKPDNSAEVAASQLLRNIKTKYRDIIDMFLPDDWLARRAKELGSQNKDLRAAVQAIIAIGRWKSWDRNYDVPAGMAIVINQIQMQAPTPIEGDRPSDNQKGENVIDISPAGPGGPRALLE